MLYNEYEPEKNPFSLLVADLTHKCNMECANCYIPNRDVPDMDVQKLYTFLNRLPKRIIVRLIGAEPTMRRDLCDIIRNVKKNGHNVSLTTNGLKLSSSSYVLKLKEAGLRMVLISMNGADRPSAYEILDGKEIYCDMKIKALKNCMNLNMIINTGTIIAKNANEDAMMRQISLFRDVAKKASYKPKVKPILRFKSVGAIGRYMENSTYELGELRNMIPSWFQKVETDSPNHATLCDLYETDDMYLRLIDWEVDEEGVPDSGNELRGRITPDWKCAPFFEHVKANEGGY